MLSKELLQLEKKNETKSSLAHEILDFLLTYLKENKEIKVLIGIDQINSLFTSTTKYFNPESEKLKSDDLALVDSFISFIKSKNVRFLQNGLHYLF